MSPDARYPGARGVGPDTKERIRQILLSRVGRANAIHAKTIANMVGVKDDAVSFATRQLITELIDEGVPIAATTGSGYFIVETLEESEAYLDSLRSRIAGIEKRIAAFDKAYAAAERKRLGQT